MKKLIYLGLLILTVLGASKFYGMVQVKKASHALTLVVNLDQDPLQTPSQMPAFNLVRQKTSYTIQPLYDYEIHSELVAKKNYTSDASSDVSSTDLALAWGDLTHKANSDNITYTQRHRWYYYNYKASPSLTVDQGYIQSHSANTHIISGSKALTIGIDSLKEGDHIILKGYLVNVTGPNFSWMTSQRRDDSGAGACEVLYLTYLYVNGRVFQ